MNTPAQLDRLTEPHDDDDGWSPAMEEACRLADEAGSHRAAELDGNVAEDSGVALGTGLGAPFMGRLVDRLGARVLTPAEGRKKMGLTQRG